MERHMMRTCRDHALTPVIDRRLRALLGHFTHSKTEDVLSVVYFCNEMTYILRHIVNIDCLYSNNNGATAHALLVDEATARHPTPGAPVVTLVGMPRAMVVRPQTYGIPLHRVCHDLPDGHVAVMPITVYLTLSFPTAFRLASGSTVESGQIERGSFIGMISNIAFTDFFSHGVTFSQNMLDAKHVNIAELRYHLKEEHPAAKRPIVVMIDGKDRNNGATYYQACVAS
jgi:hypothetical protein